MGQRIAKRVSVPIAVLGLAAVGVDIFALIVNPTIHTVVALLAFSIGGVAVILASRVASRPSATSG